MHGPETCFCLAVPVWSALASLFSDSLLAYGPAPGMEFIPYFLGLAAWAGLAFLSVLLSPFTALIRRLRRSKKVEKAPASKETEVTSRQDASGEDPPNGK